MSTRTMSLARLITIFAIWIAIALPIPGFAATADDANAGKTLRTFQLAGTAADCSSNTPGIGTSIALVQGSKINQPQSPVVLVTSCLASGGGKTAIAKRATLYFIDPVAGTLLATIQTRAGIASVASST